jgi:FkbM family methyltransferase
MLHQFANVREIVRHPLNRASVARAVRRYLQWNIGRRLLDAEYVLPLANGARIILSNGENYATLCYTCGIYDFAEMAFMLHFLREGDTFGDFGSNVGVYSVLAGSVGAKVIAVEPVPATFAALQRNIQLNGLDAKTLNVGLADAPGVLRFTSNLGGMNRVARPTDTSAVEVKVTTADAIGANIKMAKIDVEGFELPLLKGAKRLLATGLDAIVIELNGSGKKFGFSDEAVDKLLRRAGFEPFSYDPVARKVTPLETFNRDSFNTLYLRESVVLSILDRVRAAKPFTVRGQTF